MNESNMMHREEINELKETIKAIKEQNSIDNLKTAMKDIMEDIVKQINSSNMSQPAT